MMVAAVGAVVASCKAGAGAGLLAEKVIGFGWMGSRCGKSGGLGNVRYTTVLLDLGGGGASEDLKTQPVAHNKTTACKASDKKKAKNEGLRGMNGRRCSAAPETVRPAGG